MKRFAMIVVVLCLLLCSCTVENQTDRESNTDAIETTGVDQSVNDGKDLAYKEIERVHASHYDKAYYGFQRDKTLIRISYPSEWLFTKNDTGTLSVFRENRIIGELRGDYASDTDQWTSLASQNNVIDSGTVSMRIERKGEASSARYRYRFVYEYVSGSELRAVTLTVDCAEVSEMTELKLFMDAQVVENGTSETLGMLNHLPEPSKILILGNSFVGSSNIGAVLSELLEVNQKNCEVTAISRGMANVATYANDADMVSRLASGQYDVLFLCGFYSSGAVDSLSVLVNACEKSGTPLVIFPAHNESLSAVSSACSKYKSVYCLNWKAELDRLISTGVSRWDLCVDDMYDHSKPLAGYVGSHLIYRALYGESPEQGMRFVLSQAAIDAILGNYHQRGDSKFVDADKITYFRQSTK